MRTAIRNPKAIATGGVKSAVFADTFRRRILQGELKPGERLPSFAELRTSHGAAHNTVERVYAALEREGLVRREQGRGVFVAYPASKARQHAIGLADFDSKTLQSSYWVHLLNGIQEVLHREDMELVLLKPESTRGLDRIDALLVHGCGESGLPSVAPLMPRVSLMERMQECSSVVSDDFEGTRLATQHLLELGHRKIACFNFLKSRVNQHRLAGYRSALQESGIPIRDKWIRDLETSWMPTLREKGWEMMANWLAADWVEQGCTAVLCQNDAVAIGVMQALREFGIRVPRDVSVIGFDGTEEGEFSTPHLTSVEVPLEEIGKTAVELLLRQLHEKPSQPISIMVPVRLVVRDSTVPPLQN